MSRSGDHEFFGIQFTPIKLSEQANSYFTCCECFAVTELGDTIAHAKHHDSLNTTLREGETRIAELEEAIRELQRFMRDTTGDNVLELPAERQRPPTGGDGGPR